MRKKLQLEWATEKLYPDYQQSFKILKLIYQKQSPFQNIKIIQSKQHGRVLFLDDILQLTESDEYIYHEMIAHVPLCTHPNPKKVLIIGGGDGGVAQRILEHPNVQATLVEIDKSVVEVAKKHLKKISNNVFSNPRLETVYTDGLEYLSGTDQTYDVIITDRGDDIGPGKSLYQKKYYEMCKKCLNSNGILVSLAGIPFMQDSSFKKNISILKKVFAFNSCFLVTVPTYVGGQLAITWSANSTKQNLVPKKRLQERFGNLKTRYYNPEVHASAFALPQSIQHLFK